MKWTKDIPTVSGWYWYQELVNCHIRPVYLRPDGRVEQYDNIISACYFREGRWSEQIPEPEEMESLDVKP